MLTRHRHGKNKKKVIKRMNIRIRNKEDAFFIIGTTLLLPLIDFFQDFRIGKKTKKGFQFSFNFRLYFINFIYYFSDSFICV